MPMMTTRAVNAEFESEDRGEYATIDEAYSAVLAAGVGIASSEILRGRSACIVELSVSINDGVVRRGAVSMAAARLRSDAVEPA